jgi:hypothetical protein
MMVSYVLFLTHLYLSCLGVAFQIAEAGNNPIARNFIRGLDRDRDISGVFSNVAGLLDAPI